MTINSVKAVGDDQAWKREAEREIADLRKQLSFAIQQIENINRRINGA